MLYLRSRRFFDGLGRVYQEEKELNQGNFAISVHGWGTRGEPSCEALPFEGPGLIPNECAAVTSARLETDFDALLRVLDPQITWTTYAPDGVVVKLGATEVIAAVDRGARASVVARRVLVNGEPGVMTWSRSGAPLSVMACRVRNGRLVDVVALVDPRRLAAMETPPYRPAEIGDE